VTDRAGRALHSTVSTNDGMIQTSKQAAAGTAVRLADGYHAFMSYSHRADSVFAGVLHYAIETFGTPLFRSRTLRLFKDDASLAMTDDLWAEIERHLVVSAHLLVLLSPRAARSKWVTRELKTFIIKRGVQHVGLVLTAGKLPWTDHDFEPLAEDAAVTSEMMEMLSDPMQSVAPLVIDLR
jgi:hypothetical protein